MGVVQCWRVRPGGLSEAFPAALEGTEVLVISRKKMESVILTVGGEVIEVKVMDNTTSNQVRLGITASPAVAVYREEICPPSVRAPGSVAGHSE